MLYSCSSSLSMYTRRNAQRAKECGRRRNSRGEKSGTVVSPLHYSCIRVYARARAHVCAYDRGRGATLAIPSCLPSLPPVVCCSSPGETGKLGVYVYVCVPIGGRISVGDSRRLLDKMKLHRDLGARNGQWNPLTASVSGSVPLPSDL